MSESAEISEFANDVLTVVDRIPEGEVMTYGEVAEEAGRPGAARGVGSVLREHGEGHPWWRVVAANGRLVPHGLELHTDLLQAEGVVVVNGRVSMGS